MADDIADVSAARLTAGSKLQRIPNSSPGGDYETIAETMEVGDFGAESELKDVTRITDFTKVFLLGLPEGVEFPVRCNWVTNDQHQELLGAQATGIAGHFRLLMPVSEGGSFTFRALTRGWRFPVTANVPQEIRFTMKITGTISYNAGSPA